MFGIQWFATLHVLPIDGTWVVLSLCFSIVCAPRLFQQVAEEAACGQLVHASAGSIAFILLLRDAANVRIFRVRMDEYHAADACNSGSGNKK